jgi:hypothetical protein
MCNLSFTTSIVVEFIPLASSSFSDDYQLASYVRTLAAIILSTYL